VSEVDLFIERAQRLPAAPTVVLKVLRLTREPETSADVVAELVQREPTLSARMLKLANSAFFGMRGRVETARRAVVVLGFKTVASMAMVVWSHTLSLSTKDRSLQAIYRQLFKHGLAVAVLARDLAARVEPSAQETAFQAGLLHDIGRVSLCAELGPRYWEEVLGLSGGEGIDAELAERRWLGFDHAEMGAALMLKWGLPSSLVDAVAAHHEAVISPMQDVVTRSVALGNFLAGRQGWDLLPAPADMPGGDVLAQFRLGDQQELDAFLTASAHKLATLVASVS
jgi:putative nucleotidyltransferase with HDIG domain